jgi:serine/threonine protein kinase
MSLQQQKSLNAHSQLEADLCTLRDSLEKVPDWLAKALNSTYSKHFSETTAGSASTSGMSGDFVLADNSSKDATQSMLREILNDGQQRGKLAQALVSPSNITLHREVTRIADDIRNNRQVSHHEQHIANQPSTTVAPINKWFSGPGSKPDMNLPSIRRSQTDEVDVGSLELDFSIDCDNNGDPRVLGKGGMGYVLVGIPTRPGPNKAIKVCHNPPHEPRMIREFELLSMLNLQFFPCAERLYRNQDGALCYSMKLVNGESLLTAFQAFHRIASDPLCTDANTISFIEDYLSVKRPAPGAPYSKEDIQEAFRAVLNYLIDVATAVQAMHDFGIIHRDIKPDNIRLEQLTRKPILLDFGLAKLQTVKDLDSDTVDFQVHGALTNPGAISGTLEYMAPEQAEGKSNTPHTAAVDIYSLGATLYHLITGSPAINTTSAAGKRRPLSEIVMQIRNGDVPVPVRLPALKSSVQKFSDLEAICRKAMSLKPSDRYASANDMIRDLRAWLSGNKVQAFAEFASKADTRRYRLHHWIRSNPGAYNTYRTVILGLFAMGGAGVTYTAYENGKAHRAAVVGKDSLSRISSSIERQIDSILGGLSLEAIPVRELDSIMTSGELARALKTAREQLQTELLKSSGSAINRYSSYGLASSVLDEAEALDVKLANMQNTLDRRASERREVRRQLMSFREEFSAIRDFVGNDLETRLSDTSQERIDRALSKYLDVFKDAPKQELQGVAPRLFFPDCSRSVEGLSTRLTTQELTSGEVQEIRAAVSSLLSYKVLTLQRSRASGYAPHVVQFLQSCDRYLEHARNLKGGEPGAFDIVLWWRIADALRQPRANALRAMVADFTTQALAGEGAVDRFSSQDLGILAKGLLDEYRFHEALKLFESIVVRGSLGANADPSLLPQRYLGELGKAIALGSLASRALETKDLREAHDRAIEANWSFNRALGSLAFLPDDSDDKRAKEAICWLGIARIQINEWRISSDEIFLQKMRVAHDEARKRGAGAYLNRNIGVDLLNTGNTSAAAEEFTQAIMSAPYLSNELLPLRASCYARLDLREDFVADIEAVLQSAQSLTSTAAIPPKDLVICARTVGEFMMQSSSSLTEKEAEDYLNLMRRLLSAVKISCSRGAPYTLSQLSLNAPSFDILKGKDPEFWRDYVDAVSRHQAGDALRE